MILIVGASGVLGGRIANLLLDAGKPVRALGRTPAKLEALRARGAEVVQGDLRDRASLDRACAGVRQVLTTAAAFETRQMAQVDGQGNRNLVDAARAAGVAHFVFTSAHAARADSPVDFFRAKFAAEEYLRASGVPWTVLRPAAFMERWGETIGGAIAGKGIATILGSGENPINFVSVEDVARVAVQVLDDPDAPGRSVPIGGPENLSMEEVARIYERVLGVTAKRKRAPLPVMRILGAVTAPVSPVLSRMMRAGVMMDTTDQTLGPSETLRRYPIQPTRMEDWVRAHHAAPSAPRASA
jgi:uncharacterized protein YbjT (DUF2867 family)